MTIRLIYALDPATVRAIEDMARKLGVSKSEALRRAVRLAAGRGTKPATARPPRSRPSRNCNGSFT